MGAASAQLDSRHKPTTPRALFIGTYLQGWLPADAPPDLDARLEAI
jgi:hypothetical protein